MPFCNSCGNEMSDQDIFCGKCGMKIEEIENVNTQNVTANEINDSLAAKNDIAQAPPVPFKKDNNKGCIIAASVSVGVVFLVVVILFIVGMTKGFSLDKFEKNIGEISSKDGKSIALNDTISADNFEFKVVKYYFADKIVPTNPAADAKSYKINDSDKVFFCAEVMVVNTSDIDLGTGWESDELEQVPYLVYDDKYEYRSIQMADAGGYITSDYYILPLQSAKKILYIIEVPLEVQNNTKKEVTFYIYGDDRLYKMMIRSNMNSL